MGSYHQWYYDGAWHDESKKQRERRLNKILIERIDVPQEFSNDGLLVQHYIRSLLRVVSLTPVDNEWVQAPLKEWQRQMKQSIEEAERAKPENS